MRFSVSNITLPSYQHTHLFPALADMGLQGIEVATSRAWRVKADELSAQDIRTYRREAERSGLQVVGLHSLFFDRPNLNLFASIQDRKSMLAYLNTLSKICRDLGGRTLIFGSPPARRRGNLEEEEAFSIAIDFMSDLADLISDHETTLCFEPLGPDETDFILSIYDSYRLVKSVGKPALGVQLDTKALAANNEASKQVVADVADALVHVHASELGLTVLGSSGAVPHANFGRWLEENEYDKFVTIEQRMQDEDDPLAAIRESVQVLKSAYGLSVENQGKENDN